MFHQAGVKSQWMSEKRREKQQQRPQKKTPTSPERHPERSFQLKDRTGKVHGKPIPLNAEPEAKSGIPPKPVSRPPKERDRPIADRDRPAPKKHSKRDESRGRDRDRSPGRDHERDRNRSRNSDRGGKPARGGRDRDGHQDRDRDKDRARAKYADGQKLKATVDKNRKGFAFLSFEKRTIEDAFVSPRDAQNLFHGDRVEITLGSRGDIIDLRVLEHRFREVVGRYTPHPSGAKAEKGGWVIYERKRAREEIFVPKGSATAQAGD